MFVDATGRRHRRVRRIAYAVGAACIAYTGLVAASIVGQPARPGALALLPAPTERPHSVVRPTRSPKAATSGVPLPSGDPRRPGELSMRLRSRVTDLTSAPHPQPEATAPRTESTPPPTPTVGPPASTEPPYPALPDPTYQPGPDPTDQPEPGVTDQPEPGATDQPEPSLTDSPTPGPTPQAPQSEPPAVRPNLALPSAEPA